MNELELVISVQQGDSDSFRKLFHLYQDKAVRTAYHITGSRATAEDAAQDAFVKCYVEIGNLKNPEAFKTWFYRLLVRTAWRYVALEKRNVPLPEAFEEAKVFESKSTEQQYLEREMTDILYEQIKKLDAKKRTAVMLFYYNELTTKEIAQVMGCLEGTVKSRLYFARKMLKSNLERLELKEDIPYEKIGSESII